MLTVRVPILGQIVTLAVIGVFLRAGVDVVVGALTLCSGGAGGARLSALLLMVVLLRVMVMQSRRLGVLA